MSAVLKEVTFNSINNEIESHKAWFGKIAGLSAEKLLRGKNQPYLHLIRAGEPSTVVNVTNYYVSFILPDFSIRHQPITITITDKGWCYENYGGGGPYASATIDDVLHLIMHCDKHECTPFVNTQY